MFITVFTLQMKKLFSDLVANKKVILMHVFKNVSVSYNWACIMEIPIGIIPFFPRKHNRNLRNIIYVIDNFDQNLFLFQIIP